MTLWRVATESSRAVCTLHGERVWLVPRSCHRAGRATVLTACAADCDMSSLATMRVGPGCGAGLPGAGFCTASVPIGARPGFAQSTFEHGR